MLSVLKNTTIVSRLFVVRTWTGTREQGTTNETSALQDPKRYNCSRTFRNISQRSRHVSRYICSSVRTVFHDMDVDGHRAMFHDMFVHKSGLRRAQGTQKWIRAPKTVNIFYRLASISKSCREGRGSTTFPRAAAGREHGPEAVPLFGGEIEESGGRAGSFSGRSAEGDRVRAGVGCAARKGGRGRGCALGTR